MSKSISYQKYLLESLKNSEEAAGYLNAALETGDTRGFLIALKNVIDAQGGMKQLAEATHKSRTSLYKMVSEQGNPYLITTHEVLAAMGMHLTVKPEKQSRRSQ
ncbi:MAG: putative addiction module antidote protein [Gammaproteobacteria bacterium]|nr:putative addiction module antidote protein [Gammaproteobacteria bacterium]